MKILILEWDYHICFVSKLVIVNYFLSIYLILSKGLGHQEETSFSGMDPKCLGVRQVTLYSTSCSCTYPTSLKVEIKVSEG